MSGKNEVTHKDKWWGWALALGITLLLRWLLPAAVIEKVYSRGIFTVVRTALDNTVNRLPVPLFYVFWLVVLFVIVRFFWLWARSRAPWRPQAAKVFRFLAFLVITFLWGWGFNYGRLPVEEELGFSVHQPQLTELRSRVRTEAETLRFLRARHTTDTLALTAADFPADLEAAIRPILAQTLEAHGYPAPGRPRARLLEPKGVLMRLSTAGVYWPWAAEGNVDAGLHPLQQPAVMAHELSHAYGFGGEGTCSFWAWLTHAQTNDPVLEYAIRLAHWRRLAGRLRMAEPEAYWAWRAAELDPGIRNDLRAIYDNSALYQDFAPAVRDAAYSTYLKAQGIQEGLLNYGRVVQLVEGYLREHERQPSPAF